jgi:hypothetical protein
VTVVISGRATTIKKRGSYAKRLDEQKGFNAEIER